MHRDVDSAFNGCIATDAIKWTRNRRMLAFANMEAPRNSAVELFIIPSGSRNFKHANEPTPRLRVYTLRQ